VTAVQTPKAAKAVSVKTATPVLEVKDLAGYFQSDSGPQPVLLGVSYRIERGAVNAIVGETGSGKSLTSLMVLGLQPPTFVRTSGEILFEGENLLMLSPAQMRAIRGGRIAMVFQDARAALNPVFSVGTQLIDVFRLHHPGTSKPEARARSVEALKQVHIPEPERRMKQYAHEFSGGMAQRVMIAMALLCEPEFLILDEPTTGLDVSIQAEIMSLIVELGRHGGSLTTCLITHDLGVVAETCDFVTVMNAGRVVETGTTEQILTDPQDPYTQRLLAASRLKVDD
jgi:ABC-type dipeptide/oligopeptide/nickel transport system ATPase component